MHQHLIKTRALLEKRRNNPEIRNPESSQRMIESAMEMLGYGDMWIDYLGHTDETVVDIQLHDGTIRYTCYPTTGGFCTDTGVEFAHKDVKMVRRVPEKLHPTSA